MLLNPLITAERDTPAHKFRDVVAALVLYHAPDDSALAIEWLQRRHDLRAGTKNVFEQIEWPSIILTRIPSSMDVRPSKSENLPKNHPTPCCCGLWTLLFG